MKYLIPLIFIVYLLSQPTLTAHSQVSTTATFISTTFGPTSTATAKVAPTLTPFVPTSTPLPTAQPAPTATPTVSIQPLPFCNVFVHCVYLPLIRKSIRSGE